MATDPVGRPSRTANCAMRPSPKVLAILAASFAALACAVALNFGFWWIQGRPQNIPDAHDVRIKSASFSPYRRGQSPFGATFTPRQLEEDMTASGAARKFNVRAFVEHWTRHRLI